MELIQMLVGQLGVSEDQAKGGVGLLMKLAQDKLGGEDFGQIASALPGVEGLMDAAPESGGIAGMVGKIASALGAGHMGGLASLAGGFKNLGLDADMVGKFTPIVMEYLQSQGGDSVKGLLEKVFE